MTNNEEQYRPNAFAVIIGINKYQDKKIPDLGLARADAEGIYRILTDPDIGRFSPDNVFLYLDEQATRRNICTAISTEIPRLAGEDAVVFIYFAGHGSPVIDPKCSYSDGMEKYLIPTDAEINNLRATGIAMEDIKKYFSWIESKQVFFFIDSCYSGEAGGRTFSHAQYQRRNLLTSEFLDNIASEGRVVITACDVNEVSLEFHELGHGLFTYHLIEGLKGEADKDNDSLVTINELYEHVYENVTKYSRQLGGSMHPIQKGIIKGKIFLTQCSKKPLKSKSGMKSGVIKRKTPSPKIDPSKVEIKSKKTFKRKSKRTLKEKLILISILLGVIISLIKIFDHIIPIIKKEDNLSKHLSLQAVNNMPESLFISLCDSYRSDSLLFVQLQSDSSRSVQADIQFEIKISGLPSFKETKRIKNNFHGTKICTVNYPIMREALNKLTSNRITPARAFVNLKNGGFESDPMEEDIKIYNKNYIDFSNKQLLSAFITPGEIELRKLRPYIDSSLTDFDTLAFYKQFENNIIKAVNLYHWLHQYGLSLDPKLRNLDITYLQFPVETLIEKTGTSNDLAVLYTTLLQVNDVNSIVFPLHNRHLIVFLNTKIKKTDSFLINPDENRFEICIDNDDNIWLPLDMSKYNQSFTEAWFECRNFTDDLPKTISDRMLEQFKGTIIPHDWKFEQSYVDTLKLFQQVYKRFFDWRQDIFNKLESRGDEVSYNKYAMICLKIEDAPKALTYLDKSLKLNPKNPTTHLLYGRAYFQLKNFEEAINYFNKAIEIDSHYAEAYFRLACYYKEIGNIKKANEAFERGRDIDLKLSRDFLDCYPEIE